MAVTSSNKQGTKRHRQRQWHTTYWTALLLYTALWLCQKEWNVICRQAI